MLLHPKKETFEHLDPRSREIMLKTVAFFENKGKAKLKHDDHERVWYADFLEFVKEEKVFCDPADTPTAHGQPRQVAGTPRQLRLQRNPRAFTGSLLVHLAGDHSRPGAHLDGRQRKSQGKDRPAPGRRGIFAFGLSRKRPTAPTSIRPR
jgi:hypothetical protein